MFRFLRVLHTLASLEDNTYMCEQQKHLEIEVTLPNTLAGALIEVFMRKSTHSPSLW